MGGDPLDDILDYLGLGQRPSGPAPQRTATKTRSAVEHDDELCLATAGSISLWLTGNDGAEWIEVRGPFPTVRATRPKAQLLISVRTDLERWAEGDSPEMKVRDLAITTVRRFGQPNLELRHRTWKPIRLSREQACAVLRFLDPIRNFARG